MADHRRGKRVATSSELALRPSAPATPESYVGKRRAAPASTVVERPQVPQQPSRTAAGKRRADVPTQTGEQTDIPQVAGKRRADVPAQTVEAAQAVEQTSIQPVAAERTSAQPATAKRSTSPASREPGHGRRRASLNRRQSHTGLTRLRPSPSRIGFVALAVSIAGAVSVGPGGVALASVNIQQYSGQANALNGASAVVSTGARLASVSRSSDRTSLTGATNADLVAAAEEQAAEREAALSALQKDAEKYAAFVAKNAWRLPIPAGVYNLTARFGEYGLWSGMHTGLDFAAPTGTPITSVANGLVTFAGYDGAYGNKVVVTLENGTELWYCHMSAISVSEGETVVGGQQVGNVGSTGHTTGPHLHLEVRPGAGDPVDPYEALVYHGVNP